MQGKKILLVFGMLLGVFISGIGYTYFVSNVSKQKPVAASKVEQAAKVNEVTVTGTEYAFSPSALNVTKGEQVKLVFVNNGKQPHNLIVDELNLMTSTIPGGQKTTLEFTPDKTGSFKMYCSVGNHRALGMEGMMEVK